MEETGVPGENHWLAASHWQLLSHKVVSSTPRTSVFELSTLVVIGIDYIGSNKSNYHTLTTTTAPWWRHDLKEYCTSAYMGEYCLLTKVWRYQKGALISHKSKHRQCTGQKQKNNKTRNGLQNAIGKTKHWVRQSALNNLQQMSRKSKAQF